MSILNGVVYRLKDAKRFSDAEIEAWSKRNALLSKLHQEVNKQRQGGYWRVIGCGDGWVIKADGETYAQWASRYRWIYR